MQKSKKKLFIKKGDNVIVTSGASKGVKGEVLEVFVSDSRVVVEGVNIVKRHTKPTNDSQGGIIEKPAPIHISNVSLIDPSSGQPCRVGRRKENGKTVRYSKKSGEIIE